ncbi:lysylphosphatidylglycerol synthase transmembrane domain-containing protein [Halonatronum saccharophilum]|uniref:lysylphosphatidylglycerol synthase transmembrane domain-containing protein n=1 Tax=Halonatronum saccharophilum TaxID=150060 RepID=UPI0004804DFD|nr:lysylphosphatidylglycerol synthase transmembrane domain-containing protein [Halonatronum saccharophilum]
MEGAFDKRKVIFGLKISVIISVITLVYLFSLTIDEDTVQKAISINPFYLTLAFIVNILIWIAGGWRIKLLVQALGEEISLKKSVEIFLSGSFISNVTPFASGGGPFQIVLLHSEKIPLGKASAVMILQFLLKLIFFNITTPILFWKFRYLIDLDFISPRLFNIVLGLVFSISVLVMIFIWQANKIKVLIKLLEEFSLTKKLLRRKVAQKIIKRLYKEVDEATASLKEMSYYKKSTLIWAFIATALFWVLFFIVAPIILLGLGEAPFFLESFVIQMVFYLILPYIPTPGGSGVAELGFVSLFTPFFARETVGLLAIFWRVLTFYSVLVIGGVVLYKLLDENVVL